jgi:hypothetical protein
VCVFSQPVNHDNGALFADKMDRLAQKIRPKNLMATCLKLHDSGFFRMASSKVQMALWGANHKWQLIKN